MKGSFFNILFATKKWFWAILLGVGLLISLLLIINSSRPTRTPADVVTAALTVVPSFSSTITPTIPENLQIDLPTETPTLLPGTFGVGSFVQVSGTGGDGLRLRQGPGLEYEMQFLGLEGELFQVGDGPVESDGYSWWFVVGSYDETRQGWAAADFLLIVPNP